MQVLAKQRWQQLFDSVAGAASQRPVSVAQRLTSMSRARARLGCSVHNYVSSRWLTNVAFLCWRAQAYATCTQQEARQESSQSTALREHVARFLSTVGTFAYAPPA